MRTNTLKRLMSLALSLVMLFSVAAPVYSAEKTDDAKEDTNEEEFAVLSEHLLEQVTYDEYLDKHADKPLGTDEVVIKAVDYDEKKTTAQVNVKSDVYGKADEVLEIPSVGDVTWTFNVEKAGMYSLKFEYAAVNDKKTDIERVLYINGTVPYTEARNIELHKLWRFDYTEQEDGSLRFETDVNGNESRPSAYCDFQWLETEFTDANTYYMDPFRFYFKEGENTITFRGMRDDLYMSTITLYHAEEVPTYEEVLKEYQAKGYTDGNAVIHIDAELPSSVSNYTIYPDYDRSSAINEPQDPILIKRNVVGGDNWQTPGEWVKYDFTVPEGGAGLYTIALRFKQDISDGVFASRAIKIDGEEPFLEARGCRFAYGTDWQVTTLADGNYKFSFYLEEGDHTIELMATLGDFASVLSQVQDIADVLNDYYLKMMKLTGASPDPYRDYGFTKIMPDVVEGFSERAEELEALIKYIEDATTSAASSNSILESMVTVLKEMASDESEIAPNLSAFRDAVSSISSWVADYQIQPLLVDYIQIQSAQAELPRATASAVESLKYEFAQFVGSFYADYNSLAAATEEDEVVYEKSLNVWTSSSRDEAQIMRNLIDAGFCRESQIGVNLRLVDAGALLPSILAGIGPDVSLDAASPIDYALRGACQPFNDLPGFDEVMERFVPATIVPNSLFGKTYAIPYTISFSMMFVRMDIFNDLGLEVPKTWEELLAIVPVLQYNNMDVGMANDFQMFLYQRGGNIWDETSANINEHGWRTTFENNDTLSAFEDMVEMFTQYSLPISYNANTRFKDGGMPILISNSGFYTEITIAAPEISGLWEMYPIPGTMNEDGEINNDGIVGTSGLMLLKGCSDIEGSWELIKWITDVDFQVDRASEMVALLGESAKSSSANIAAMSEMPWDSNELGPLLEQMEHLVGIPSYPGSYIIGRYTDFAFNAAYNDKKDPVTELLSYVGSINAEITRKRKEFELPLYTPGETTSEE